MIITRTNIGSAITILSGAGMQTMTKNPTLSRQLQEFIADMESDCESELPPDELKDHESAGKLAKAIMLYMLASRETLAPLTGATFQKFEELITGAPELVGDFLDEHYTKTMLAEVGSYVARTLELSRMQAEGTPSDVTNTYLREATRTYIHGLPQACVALSRAALEQSLKDVLGHQMTGSYLTFQALVEDALKWDVLDKATARMTRSLAREGDSVLHERPTDLKKASEVLIGVRGLVQQIYSSRGGC